MFGIEVVDTIADTLAQPKRESLIGQSDHTSSGRHSQGLAAEVLYGFVIVECDFRAF